ncbi:MAG TPA: hypothetical protein VFT72_07935 [Opitutaceae bacterium]|nr:hypothetical protein [Opitutaceae bacterium]
MPAPASFIVRPAKFLRAFSRVAILAASFSAASFTATAADAQRFAAVKEWDGTFTSQAGSAGERVGTYSTLNYNSHITVSGHFHLNAFYDPNNGNKLSWRGTGEAVVRVNGQRVDREKEQVTTDTFSGDYTDTIQVALDSVDFAKGTYQMMVIIDRWQFQPHRGKAITHLSVRTNRYGSYRNDSMDNGHAWNNDAGAGFGRPSKFPEKGLVLTDTLLSNNNDFLSEDGSHWVTTWSIHPAGPEFEEPLKANAGGPYVVERGGTLNLDGLLSTGRIKTYSWSFEPVNTKSAIPFNTGAAKEGRRVPLVALEKVKATLTVSDGQKEDKDSVIIEVKARDYHTPFVHRTQEKIHPNSIRPRLVKGHDTEFVGGENVCALDDYSAKDSVHRLHPGSASGSWEDRGYTLKKVEDAGGPFDGVWYVSTYLMRIEREVLMNKYILPGGPPPVSTTTPFYETNQKLGNDVEAYVAAARRHELHHSELIQESLKKNDPGPKIEALAYKDKAEIKQRIDEQIQKSEDVIDKDSADPLAKKFFTGKIAFPNDATDEYESFIMTI